MQGRKKANQHFLFIAALYLKWVALYKKKYVYILKIMTLLFLYKLRAKSLSVLFRLIDRVFCFILLIDNMFTIEQQTILSINFTIFAVYYRLDYNRLYSSAK